MGLYVYVISYWFSISKKMTMLADKSCLIVLSLEYFHVWGCWNYLYIAGHPIALVGSVEGIELFGILVIWNGVYIFQILVHFLIM